MKSAVEWLNEVAEAVANSMFSRTLPPGSELETLINQIQADALSPGCPPGIPEDCHYKLKPCPFCAGEAMLRRTPENGVYIDCNQCNASSKLAWGDKVNPVPLVVEAWNARGEFDIAKVVSEICEAYGHAPHPNGRDEIFDIIYNALTPKQKEEK